MKDVNGRTLLGIGLALAIALGTGGVVALASGAVTFSACLTPGGTLTRVTVSPNAPAPCGAQDTAVSWSQAGPPGPKGGPGPQGQPGVSGLQVVVVTAPTGQHTATASCPVGKTAIGGGASSSVEQIDPVNRVDHPLSQSVPVGDPSTGWFAKELFGFGQGGATDAPHGLTVFAICATVAP